MAKKYVPVAYVPPKPGRSIQVIGAGMPRTGTNSFLAAVSYLLDGPAYHAGVQWAGVNTSERIILTTCAICETIVPPYKTPDQRGRAMAQLQDLLDGYVCTADPPLSQLTPELLELYPDAVVICTVRDRTAWVRSAMDMIRIVMSPAMMGGLFFWMPSIRHLPRLYDALGRTWSWRYGQPMRDEASAVQAWEKHIEQLKEWVPAEKLFFFDVRDGWEPLCKALDKPVPKDMPFPRLNDTETLRNHFEMLAKQAVQRWLVAIAVGVGMLAIAWKFVFRS